MAKKTINNESGIVNQIKDITRSDVKAYYILYKYYPEVLSRKSETFEELKSNYSAFKDGTTEEMCETHLITDENMQKAVRFLLGKLHQQKVLELYQKLYEKAIDGDTSSFKEFVKFGKDYFADSEEDELAAILRNVKITDDE